MKSLHMLAYILLWVGGLNWGLIGFFNYNLVEMVLGASMTNWVYMLVGLSTVYVAFTHMGDCKVCGKK
ncbi:MAG TPA: DUF378 domain-containing protein [Patescibacteria group bacterium]|nr:DUF378 domain-containing protein [Patescibacteria group bacterium]